MSTERQLKKQTRSAGDEIAELQELMEKRKNPEVVGLPAEKQPAKKSNRPVLA